MRALGLGIGQTRRGASDGPSLVQRRARGSCMFMLYKDAYACSCMYMCLCV